MEKKTTTPNATDRRLYRKVIYSRIIKDTLFAYLGQVDKKKILDAGCGTGLISRILKTTYTNSSVVGIDIDKKELSKAKSIATKSKVLIKYTYGDILNLPIKNKMFDICVMGLVLHGFRNKNDQARAIRETYRVLKKPGCILIIDTTEVKGVDSLLRAAKFKNVKKVETLTHNIYSGEKY